MTSALAGFKGGRISRRRTKQDPAKFWSRHTIQEYEPKTHEEIHRLNQAAKDTCAWETTWQTEEA